MQLNFNRALPSILFIIGAIVLATLVFHFSGLIEIQVGADGWKVVIDGRP